MSRRVTLPQARAKPRTAGCGPPRRSRRGRWRALSLILVHVAAAAHIAHWMITGTTLTPVEPSEAAQTLGQQALLNAGFVLFALLILSTLVFGRFFCGWGCHVVALQDLCTWLLNKVGIHPRPFRSRLLVFVPLVAFAYLFIVPTIVRLWIGAPRADLQTHFLTDDFWDRFPSWPISLLTFAVCGFLIVYLLGNKGFCTYACPYGGIFGVADQVAPGRILVSDACEGCGHCTATCTSNVRVHEEVRTYGMVVDPGCMKCMDCVDVCPKDALRFGFGRPSVAKGKPRRDPTRRRFDFSMPEEIALAAFFLASVVVLRGLYDRIPFLLALGLSAISAAVLMAAWRLLTTENLRFARKQLRRGGRLTRGGLVFAAVAAIWAGFLVHSGVVKALAFRGQRILADAGATQSDVQRAVSLLARSQRMGIVEMGRQEAAIARAHERLGDAEAAIRHYGRAVELEPGYALGCVRLAELRLARGESAEAADHLREALRRQPDLPGVAGDYAEILVGLDRAGEAVETLRRLVERHPQDSELRLAYGVTMVHTGDVESAEREVRRVIEQDPANAAAHFKLGQVVGNQQRFAEALTLFARAAEIEPGDMQAHTMAARAAIMTGRADVAARHLENARRLAPFDEGIVSAWAQTHEQAGTLDATIAAAERAPAGDRPTRFALMHLYRVAGRLDDANRLAAELDRDG